MIRLLAILALLTVSLSAIAGPHPHRAYGPVQHGHLAPVAPINRLHYPGVYRYASVPRWCWRWNGTAWLWLPTVDIQLGAIVAFPGWDGYWMVHGRPMVWSGGVEIGIEVWR